MTILKRIILNSSTGEAISYATISLPINGINTLSNEEGRFIFKIPADNKDNSIYIRHAGYKEAVLAITLSDTGLNTIKLEQSPHQLPDEVEKLVKQRIIR